MTLLVLLAAAILIAVFFYLSRRTSEPAVIPIVSSDGLLELQVPEGSLPAGVSPEDISIMPDSEPDLPFSIEGVNLVAYDLQPDGLTFSEPAQMKVAFGEDPQLYFSGSGDSYSLIDGVTYVFQDEGNYALVPVEHFSTFVHSTNAKPIFKLSGSASDIFEGDSITSEGLVSLTGTAYKIVYESGSIGYELVDGSQRITGAIFNSHNIDPGPKLNSPPTSAFGQSYTLTANGFTCRKAGPSFTEFHLTLNWDVKETGALGQLVNLIADQTAHMFAEIIVTFDCKKKQKPVELKCGNYIAEGSEECDNTDLRGKTCKDFGFDSGYLRCDKECRYDKTDCTNLRKISCNENTYDDDTSDSASYTCVDDCPGDEVCGPGCTCIQPDEGKSTTNDTTGLSGLPGLDEPVKEKIKVIRYGDDYIPIDQLHTFTGPECDKAEHWHANTGLVTTLKGEKVTDPNGCGFGKVSENPAIEIEVVR